MTSETLTLWENGAVTLPKEWRERYGTRHFLAKENERGYLVIMPIIDIEYYEEPDGTCGLRFPSGIHPAKLIELWDEAAEKVAKEERIVKKNNRKKNGSSRSKGK